VALAVGSLLAGCASVPSTGQVNRVVAPAEQAGPVRYEPPGPVDGATPTEIVLGFLEAQQAYPSPVEKAAQFLTPDAAASWKPAARTVVYTEVRTRGGSATVVLAARKVATVSARGDYRAEPTPELAPPSACP
jgi:hypothetical protein